jgi:hypothetical protein
VWVNYGPQIAIIFHDIIIIIIIVVVVVVVVFQGLGLLACSGSEFIF